MSDLDKKTKVHASYITKEYDLIQKKSDKLKSLFGTRKEEIPQFWALKGVSFDVFAGEAVGLIGINGSGKSTLSNIIGGIIPPTSGELVISGETSIVTIGAGLKNPLSGVENIRLKCTMSGMSNKEINENIEEIINFADLGDFIYQPVKSYSSGMKSRLGFSIAVHQNPDILIIDEALSVGDDTFYQKCVDKILDFKKEGKTIFFVSHSLGQVAKLCDKTIWMHYGDLKAFGPTNEVIVEYKKFTKWFKSLSKEEKKEYQKRYKSEQSSFSLENLYDKEVAKRQESTLLLRSERKDLQSKLQRNQVGDNMKNSTKIILVCLIFLTLLFSVISFSGKSLTFFLENPIVFIQKHITKSKKHPAENKVKSSTQKTISESTTESTRNSTTKSSEMIQSSSNKVKTYTVLPGDTWSQIAYSNNISVEELLVANERLETDSLHSGEVINIPETFNQSGEN